MHTISHHNCDGNILDYRTYPGVLAELREKTKLQNEVKQVKSEKTKRDTRLSKMIKLLNQSTTRKFDKIVWIEKCGGLVNFGSEAMNVQHQGSSPLIGNILNFHHRTIQNRYFNLHSKFHAFKISRDNVL